MAWERSGVELSDIFPTIQLQSDIIVTTTTVSIFERSIFTRLLASRLNFDVRDNFEIILARHRNDNNYGESGMDISSKRSEAITKSERHRFLWIFDHTCTLVAYPLSGAVIIIVKQRGWRDRNPSGSRSCRNDVTIPHLGTTRDSNEVSRVS